MPQKRVAHFFQKTPIEVLKETERSVGSTAMLEKHHQLEEWQKSRHVLRRECDVMEKNLAVKTKEVEEMERTVQRYQQRNALLERVQILEKKILWQKFYDRNEEYQAAKRASESHKAQVEQLRLEIAPRTVKLRETEAETRHCKEEILRLRRDQKERDTLRQKYQDELTQLVEQGDALQVELDGEAEEKERALREIEKARSDIRKLEQKIAELPDSSRALEELKEIEQVS